MIPSGARSHGFEVQSSAASIAPSATSMCCQKPPNDRVFREASSSRRILVWSSAFLLGPVPVVNTMALLRLDTSETRSRLPSRYAPSLRYAHQRVPRAGALANPATISPFDSIPISVPNVGMPRENSSVPSIGSMIIRARPELFAEFALTPPISSPSTSSASPLTATFARAISSPDLTLLPDTPSIQSYLNVCSGQHRNRSRPHSRSAARRGGPSQTRPSRNRPEVWRESRHAAPQFLGCSRA